jgi:hypothetical protein
MTLLKRLLTAAALFLPLLFVFYFGICIVGGAITGVRIAAQHPHTADLDARTREAGGAFVRNNIATIALSSFAAAGVVSLAIPFSGILPWCRKPQEVPPPLPIPTQH